MKCHHYCNTLHCPTCIRRFWKWAEQWTRGRPAPFKRGDDPRVVQGRDVPVELSFYECAVRFSGTVAPEV